MGRRARAGRALLAGLELRVCVSWALPVVGAVLLLAGLVLSGAPVVRYRTVMRTAMELGMPLCGVFLAVAPLEREWAQGTLARVLLMRLLLTITYLVIVTAIATLAGWIVSQQAGDVRLVSRWLAATLLTVLAPTIFLATAASLITHLTASALSSYLTVCAFWLANLMLPFVLPASTYLSAFLLFGWSFPPTAPNQSSWVLGKIALLLLGMLCFVLQIPILRREARLIRNTWD